MLMVKVEWEDKLESLDFGVDEYLMKFFDVEEL